MRDTPASLAVAGRVAKRDGLTRLNLCLPLPDEEVGAQPQRLYIVQWSHAPPVLPILSCPSLPVFSFPPVLSSIEPQRVQPGALYSSAHRQSFGMATGFVLAKLQPSHVRVPEHLPMHLELRAETVRSTRKEARKLSAPYKSISSATMCTPLNALSGPEPVALIGNTIMDGYILPAEISTEILKWESTNDW